VLKIQAMLHQCDEHVNSSTAKKDDKEDEKKEEKPEKPDDTFQAFAVIAIALIAMGEDIGADMSLRQFNHLVSRCFFRGSSRLLTLNRCITVNRSYEKPFHLPLGLSVLQIPSYQSSTHFRNTVTTTISMWQSMPSSPWVSSVQARTMHG